MLRNKARLYYALERLAGLCYDVAKPMKECGCQETVFTNSQVGTKIGGRPAGETSHVRNILFEQVILQSFATDSEHQVLKIKIDVTHNIWTTNRRGKCIQGTDKTRKRFEFIWTMMRPLGSRTGGTGMTDTMHCPNCGAEIDLEAFAECPFCHTPIMKISQDWVISEIDALSQRTLHE